MSSPITTVILNKVICKGGLFGITAKLYIDDKALADQFIIELSEHCHVGCAQRFWGNDLVEEIVNYSSELKQKKN